MWWVAKRIWETVLGNSAITSTLCRIKRRDVVLAYHNIVQDDHAREGDSSLHLPVGQFVEQVEWLESAFRIVSVQQLIAEPLSDSGPRVAITFDDAYEGTVRYGFPVLAAKGLPATLFVCSSWNGGETMWWDAISDPEIGGVSPAERERALTVSFGRYSLVLDSANTRNLPVRKMPSSLRIASIEELEIAIDSGPFSVGSHTRTHPNLVVLNDQELQTELSDSLAEIEARWGSRAIPWLAYPYGLANPRVVDAARVAGFEGAFLTSGGVLDRPIQSMYVLPRISVPSLMTVAGLRLRMAGLIR